MKNINVNFGELIAFLLPGFICLWGLSFSFKDISSFFCSSSTNSSETIGGFLYISLASLSIGLILSTFRQIVFDSSPLMEFGNPNLKRNKNLNMSNLKEEGKLAAFNEAIQNHYRYYQYYSNTFVAVAIAFIYYFLSKGFPPLSISLVITVVLVVLFVSSRSEISSFYERARKILEG